MVIGAKYEVVWHDAWTSIGWHSDREIKNLADGMPTTTIGYLVEETKNSVRLAPGIAANGKKADVWTIPKGIIKSKRRLK